jgi:hypothetical protein
MNVTDDDYQPLPGSLIDQFYRRPQVFDEYIGDAIAEMVDDDSSANRFQALLKLVRENLETRDEDIAMMMLGRFAFACVNDHITRLSESPRFEVLK